MDQDKAVCKEQPKTVEQDMVVEGEQQRTMEQDIRLAQYRY